MKDSKEILINKWRYCKEDIIECSKKLKSRNEYKSIESRSLIFMLIIRFSELFGSGKNDKISIFNNVNDFEIKNLIKNDIDINKIINIRNKFVAHYDFDVMLGDICKDLNLIRNTLFDDSFKILEKAIENMEDSDE